jgi:nucleoid-associated protein YgaU
VSLILDALRKLEREKDTREPGVLVVGSVAWGARTRSRRPLLLALAAVVLVAIVGFALRRGDPPPAARGPEAPLAPSEAAPRPAPAPTDRPGPPSTAAPPTPPPARRASVPSVRSAASAEPPAPAPADDDTSDNAARPGSPPSDGLRLNAISERDGRPVALINDRLLFEGESFDGVRILRIGEAEVEVEVHGKRRVLRF